MRTKNVKNKCGKCNSIFKCGKCGKRLCLPFDHEKKRKLLPKPGEDIIGATTYCGLILAIVLPDGESVVCSLPGHYITKIGRFCRECGPQFGEPIEKPRRTIGLLF